MNLLYRFRYAPVALMFSLSSVAYSQVATGGVVAEGTGTSREKAINNAILAASEQVSGVFLASDQRLEDGKITKDEIRQHTAGVVNSYEVVSCTADSGLFTCRIKAVVSPAPLRRTVEASGQSVAAFSGASAAAESMTYNQSIEEGRFLFLKTLGEWRDYVTPIVVNTTVKPMPGGTPFMGVEYKIDVQPGYIKHLQAILDRVEKTNLKLNGRNVARYRSNQIVHVTLQGDEIRWLSGYYSLYDSTVSEVLTEKFNALRSIAVQVTLLDKGGARLANVCDGFQSEIIDQQPPAPGNSGSTMYIKWYPETRRVQFAVPQDKLAQVEGVKVSVGCTDRGNLYIVGRQGNQ